MKIKYTDEQWISILKESEGVERKVIAEKYGFSVPTLQRKLVQYGIERKPFRHKTYSLDEKFFEIIDTEKKAYWLGFIVADGCIANAHNRLNAKRLQFIISEKDKYLLEKFLEDVKSNAPIKIRKNAGYKDNYVCVLQINSTKMCDDLSKYGVVPNKTGKEIFPNLPDCFVPHFIRGFFDGDGSAFISRKTLYITFTSGKEMLDDMRNYFISKLGLSKNVNVNKESRGNVYRLYYGKKSDTIKLYHWMYKDATIYLSRKHEIAQKIIEKKEGYDADLIKSLIPVDIEE